MFVDMGINKRKHKMIEVTKIAIEIDNGEVHVMNFITRGRGSDLPPGGKWLNDDKNSGIWVRDPSDENIFREITRSYSVEGRGKPVSYKIVSDHDIPKDRTYRNGWKYNKEAKCIDHDMEKCKGLHLGKMRNERARKLPELDAEWMKAFSRGDTAGAEKIERKRQKWRDMPIKIESDLTKAQTIDDLKLVTFDPDKEE